MELDTIQVVCLFGENLRSTGFVISLVISD